MFRILFLFLIVISLHANDKMNEAEAYFQNEEYEKASRLYKECTDKQENPDAAYKLGWMYENGKGVELDPKKAIY